MPAKSFVGTGAEESPILAANGVSNPLENRGDYDGQRGDMPRDMPSGVECERRNVNRRQLSRLMRFILVHADNGIDRAEIVARFYQIPKRYCGYYTDPCWSAKRKREYERQYRRAQPTVTRTLKRIERRRLIELVRRGKYVKQIRLTAAGKLLVKTLDQVSMKDIGTK